MSATDQKALEEVGEVGMRLHTALRKLCDSEESSYLWNVIFLLDETWRAFCQAVVTANAKTGAELQTVAQDVESWHHRDYSGAKESFYARQIFRVALENFDEWEGFAEYLDEEG